MSRLIKGRTYSLARYKYWHGISRRVGFDAAGPWQAWPARPIPPELAAAVVGPPVVVREPAPEPVALLETSGDSEFEPAPTVPPANGTRQRVKERAQAVVREQLANGPKPW